MRGFGVALVVVALAYVLGRHGFPAVAVDAALGWMSGSLGISGAAVLLG